MSEEPEQAGSEPVAIIGMSCLFPQAPNVDAYWRNIVNKVDAVTDPPAESWDPEMYYDPESREADRIYCKRGGFLGDLVRFDAIANNVPPNAVGGEPDQWLALQLARDALSDAGYSDLDEATRRRTGVILGRGATFNAGTAISVQHSLVITQTLKILKALHPDYSDADMEALREGLRSNLPAMGSEVVPGLVPNIVAGRIANRLDLMGPSYTIDAACASSVVAVQNGVRDLATGDCDLILAGGAQIWTPMPMLSVFCQINALSRNQQIRPFDKDADGTILGEGLGMIVLKRLADAKRDGDRIYAVITGVAVASDGKALGVMAPRLEGEELAIRRAYKAAGVEPGSIGLIEAHGTGTSVGDLTEIQALSRVFGLRKGRLPSVAVGTVKSMISHTVPAAGVAGIIKAALALHFKTLPPTLHCDEPNPKFELEKTPFYISTETRPWIHGGPQPRRAGVSAFGFGGVDSHVVLEEYISTEQAALDRGPEPDPQMAVHRPPWESEVFVLGSSSRAGLTERIQEVRTFLASLGNPAPLALEDLAYTLAVQQGPQVKEPVRAAVVATSFADLEFKLARLADRLADAACTRIQDRSGIYFYLNPLAGTGKVAFLFPGEGSQYPDMLADLCMHFPEVRRTFDAIDQVYREGGRSYVPSDFIFPRPTFSTDEERWVDSQLWDMDIAPAAVLTANEALLKVVEGLGVKPDVVLGHSSGEWSALRAAGVFGSTVEERDKWIAAALLDVYAETMDNDHIPPALLMAIGANEAEVSQMLADAGGNASIAMDNCPHQVIVAVDPASAASVGEAARARSLVVEVLEFDRPYHTPGFGPYSKRLRAALEPMDFRSPRIPVISCVTCGRFESDPASIKRLASDQWVMPVKFRQTIQDLYEKEGVRFFVEIGPRGNLSAFVEDSLRGKQLCIVPANQLRRPGITQINHLAGMLSAQGLDLNLRYLFRWRSPKLVDIKTAPAATKTAGTLLRTQFPEMRVPEELARQLRALHPVGPQAGTAAVTVVAPIEPQPADPEPAPLAPATTASVPQPGAGPPSIHTFLNTMEQFLEVQERVMLAHLSGGAGGSFSTLESSQAHVQDHTSNGQSERQVANGHPAREHNVLPAWTPMADPAIPETLTLKLEPEVALPPEPPRPVGADGDFDTVLREIVSERTGYPIETITLTADLEADLGIDSIKRVEIMGTFRQKLTGYPNIEIEQLTGQRTLQGVIDLVKSAG